MGSAHLFHNNGLYANCSGGEQLGASRTDARRLDKPHPTKSHLFTGNVPVLAGDDTCQDVERQSGLVRERPSRTKKESRPARVLAGILLF